MEARLETLGGLARRVQAVFTDFYLAGGTAIMLRHRHRESIDLDFFSQREFSFRRLAVRAREAFRVEDETEGEDNVDLRIEGVRVSFVFFPFAAVEPLVETDGIRSASDYDLFLNKVYVAGRRIDPKDPEDAGFLYGLHRWEKSKIKIDFERKFPDQSFEIFLGALLSFGDYPGLSETAKRNLSLLAA